MSTFAELQQRINTDILNRPDFTDQTKRSIQAAVRRYEKKRWWFNETATSLACVAGTSYVSLPSNLIYVDSLRLTYAGYADKLHITDRDTILQMNIVSSTGVPTHFSLYQNRINLAIVPDSAYPVPCYYVKRLATLSADADSNEWTGAFEDVIVYHAAKLMWANVIRNDGEAQKYALLEREALKEVEGQNELFKLRGIKPTRF